MLILALESSAKAASVALMEDDKLIAQYSQCSGLTHSRTLLPMVDDMLKNTENTIAGVDLIAVAHGPGSFTGIRIGVSTVKGLAWASDKRCVGVSTLEAMAWHGVPAGGIICPVMDAQGDSPFGACRGDTRQKCFPCRRWGVHCKRLYEKRRHRLPHGAVKPRVSKRLWRGHGRT